MVAGDERYLFLVETIEIPLADVHQRLFLAESTDNRLTAFTADIVQAFRQLHANGNNPTLHAIAPITSTGEWRATVSLLVQLGPMTLAILKWVGLEFLRSSILPGGDAPIADVTDAMNNERGEFLARVLSVFPWLLNGCLCVRA